MIQTAISEPVAEMNRQLHMRRGSGENPDHVANGAQALTPSPMAT
jgi:hypothetical protein